MRQSKVSRVSLGLRGYTVGRETITLSTNNRREDEVKETGTKGELMVQEKGRIRSMI